MADFKRVQPRGSSKEDKSSSSAKKEKVMEKYECNKLKDKSKK